MARALESTAVKALVLSDVVSEALYSRELQSVVGDVDVILSCGDLPYEYLDYVATVLDVPLYYVLGNHDHTVYREGGAAHEGPEAGCAIDGRVVEVRSRKGERLLVAGLGGSRCYNRGPHQYTEWEMAARIGRMLPSLWWNRWRWGRGADIVVTHAPPRGIHDGRDPCHTGFETLLRLMDWFRPLFLFHGHVHPAYGEDIAPRRHGSTDVRSIHGYSVVEVRR